MNSDLILIIIALIGSNGAWAFVMYFINRKGSTHSLVRAVSYHLLSSTVEKYLEQGYATPEARKDLEILYEAYKANGWNGDMKSRMGKVFDLPTKNLKKKDCI